MTSWEILLGSLPSYVMVMIRMLGLLVFNPIFARKNVPSLVRTALAFGITLVITPGLPTFDFTGFEPADWLLEMGKQLMFGMLLGFVFILFYNFLYYIGDVIDFELGLSMAKVFDPGTGVQTSISGRLFTLFYSLYFFITNSHLLMIRLFAESFEVVTLNGDFTLIKAVGYLITLFVSAFSLVLRLGLPFLAAEFILEMSMGILMKLIPQIHVFVINIQLKILLGFGMMLAFAGPISGFLDAYLNETLVSVRKVIEQLAG